MGISGSSLGGGGSVPVNGALPLNIGGVNLYNGISGDVYIKTGVVETDVSLYPNAYPNFGYTGTSFSVGAQDNYPSGIAWDGTHFWVTGDSTDSVYKYVKAVGYSVASTDSDTGLPIYVRIK